MRYELTPKRNWWCRHSSRTWSISRPFVDIDLIGCMSVARIRRRLSVCCVKWGNAHFKHSYIQWFFEYMNIATNLNYVNSKVANAPGTLRLRPFSGLFWYFVVWPADAMHVCTVRIAFRNVTWEWEVYVSNYVTVSNVNAWLCKNVRCKCLIM